MVLEDLAASVIGGQVKGGGAILVTFAHVTGTTEEGTRESYVSEAALFTSNE